MNILTEVEKAVAIAALHEDIQNQRKDIRNNPSLAPYVIRNIEFRENLIAKLETL